MRSFSHIVNLATFPPTSDLYCAQPITLETMRIARGFAAGQVDVVLLSAQNSEDRAIIPDYLQATDDLTRSVLDVGRFQIKRRLPLMADILDRAYRATHSDFVIYTNIDIALQPHFYLTIDHLIESGFDSLVINRRSISTRHTQLQDIPLMFGEAGLPHRGYDCFIFRRDVLPKFDLGTTCIGASYIGKIMIVNQLLTAGHFEVFKDQHVTFHIGDDKAWRSRNLRDYEDHNRREFYEAFHRLRAAQHPLMKKYIRSDRFRRLKNWFTD